MLSKLTFVHNDSLYVTANQVMHDGYQYFFNRLFNGRAYEEWTIGLTTDFNVIFAGQLWQPFKLLSGHYGNASPVSFIINENINIKGLMTKSNNEIYSVIDLPLTLSRGDKCLVNYEIYL